MDKIIVSNRKARRDYIVIKAFECGIELKGSEVKSIRDGKANLNDSFARVEKKGVLLYNMYINPYAQASCFSVDPVRKRRLLLHKRQISKIESEVQQRGFALIPLRLYFNERGFVKIEVAICKGKKSYDRRETIKRRELDRQIHRTMRARVK